MWMCKKKQGNFSYIVWEENSMGFYWIRDRLISRDLIIPAFQKRYSQSLSLLFELFIFNLYGF